MATLRVPGPGAILAVAAVLHVLLSAAIVVYIYAALSASEQPRRVHAVVAALPVVVALVVLQLLPFTSLGRRVVVSVIAGLVGVLAMFAIFYLIGCNVFSACF